MVAKSGFQHELKKNWRTLKKTSDVAFTARFDFFRAARPARRDPLPAPHQW
jgi:hypothetical protein